jgi:hypothetical protein
MENISIYDSNVDIAAPVIPYIGIRMKLNNILLTHPTADEIIRY